jgi:DnaK suppressor protein
MKPADLARHKKRLIALRDEIIAEGDVPIEPVRKDPSDTGGDQDAQPLTEMNQVIASKRNRARADVLVRVNVALGRLEHEPDAFGLCRECDEPIGKRLEALPYVELCLECQGERDGAHRPTGRKHLRDFE